MSVADTSTGQVVNLPQEVLNKCCRAYQFNRPPALYKVPITVANLEDAPQSLKLNDAEEGQPIRLPEQLMTQACVSLEQGFNRGHVAGKLHVFPFCSPHLDDGLAVDAAVVCASHMLKVDLVVWNVEDLTDGAFGHEFCSDLWGVYVAGLQLNTTGACHDDGDSSAGPGEHTSNEYESALARAVTSLRALIGCHIPHSHSKRRLLYLRNFAAMSYVIHPLLDALRIAIDECKIPLLVVAGIWRATAVQDATKPTLSAKSGEDAKFMKAFLKPDDLKTHILDEYTPGRHALREGRFCDLADVFQAAIMQHLGDQKLVRVKGRSARVKRRFHLPFSLGAHFGAEGLAEGLAEIVAEESSGSNASYSQSLCSQKVQTEFFFEDILPIFAEPHALSVASGVQPMLALIARWNVQRLRIALRDAGLHVQQPPRDVSEWVVYSGDPGANAPLCKFATQIVSHQELSALVSRIKATLPPAPSYSDVLSSIRRNDEAFAVLRSHIEAMQANTANSVSVDVAIQELVDAGRVDSDEVARWKSFVIDPATIETRYEDVHIQPHIIEALRSSLSLPLRYQMSGIMKSESVGGFLLYGPPGTGKTMLCRAFAKESGIRLLQVRYSDVQSRFVGVAEKFVHSLFEFARRIGPCVLFIDELDALFARRGGPTYPYWAQTLLTEFMQEMDGLMTAAANKASNLVVVGATNRPQDVDDAVLRRLPNRFLVDLPGRPEREKIIHHYLRHEKTDASVNVPTLAKNTNYYSGSDLKHVVLLAAQNAFRDAVKADEKSGLATATTPGSPLVLQVPPPVVISAHHFDLALKGIKASCLTNMAALRRVQRFEKSGDKPSVFALLKFLLWHKHFERTVGRAPPPMPSESQAAAR